MSGKDILIYSAHPEVVLDKVLAANAACRVRAANTPERAQQWISQAEVILAWKLPAELYAQASNLRWIQSMGAGVDDLAANTNIPKHVVITRIVGQFGGPMAEYVFAEILYRERNLTQARTLQAARQWQPFSFGSVRGKVIGVAGLGSIGQEIVRMAQAFGMTVYGLSRYRHEMLLEKSFDGSQWEDFVRDLDYLVLALPLTPATKQCVNTRIFRAMKPGAVVINVGRGQTVNQSDLTDALVSHHLGGAILDVFDQEPLPADSRLWDLPGVVITPHISGPSRDQEVAAFFNRNLQHFIQGEPLLGQIDRSQGY